VLALSTCLSGMLHGVPAFAQTGAGDAPAATRTAGAGSLAELSRRNALTVRALVLEDNGTGMNEFYVECAVETETPLHARELVRVVPTGVSPFGLTVRVVHNEHGKENA